MCTHTIFPGSSKLGVISSVCSTAVSVSWSWKEKSKNRKCVPLTDLFSLLLWVGWNGLPPTHDTLHLGYSYHLHSSHRFLSTWGAVRLVQQKKKQKKNKKQKRTLIVPATCLPSNQLRKYTPILLIAHKLSNAKSRYLLLASFPAPCWACCRLQHQVRLGNEASSTKLYQLKVSCTNCWQPRTGSLTSYVSWLKTSKTTISAQLVRFNSNYYLNIYSAMTSKVINKLLNCLN